MAHINIFKNDPFSSQTLTAGVERNPFVPTLLGSLPIWDTQRSRTKGITVESRAGTLGVIQTTERGGPAIRPDRPARQLIGIPVLPRVAADDRITADEIQDIRQFGSETELAQVQDEVALRLSGPTGLLAQVELTKENMRLGAVQGVVKDKDGSIIRDWFATFGLTRPATIMFNIGVPASVEEGAFRAECTKVTRAVARGLQLHTAAQLPVFGLAGDEYWDKMMRLPECRESFKYQEGLRLRDGLAFGTFDYGGITFINYRGTDDADELTGPGVGIANDECSFFPGTPAAFQQAYAPAESFEWVNTPGKDVYVRVIPDNLRDEFVDIEVRSYPLFICTRPLALRKGKIGAGS